MSKKKQAGLSFALVIQILLLGFTYIQQGDISIGQTVEVNTGGDNLNLRQGAGLSHPIVAKLPHGTVMTVVGGPESADGFMWWELEGTLGSGWAAADFLRTVTGQAGSTNPISDNLPCENVDAAFAGVQHCTRNGGEVHVVAIDLSDPHVRFETALGHDARDVTIETFPYQRVKDIVNNYPGVAAAINADYFGFPHGPEGLTIKNGVRLDGRAVDDNDNGAVNRSALVISKPLLDGGLPIINADVIRLLSDDQSIDFDQYFTAVGGGPQVVLDNVWKWHRGVSHPRHNGCVAIFKDVINGECFSGTGHWDNENTVWTTVGITDNNLMIWVVCKYSEIQSTFSAFNVQQAIKLDGGGSSQLWYNGVPKVDKPREIADALLVFYLRAAEVVEQHQWPIIAENETLPIELTLRNMGADTWKTGEYSLVNEKNPWGAEPTMALPHDVSPGATATGKWTTDTFNTWGIYTSEWRMNQAEEPFPGDPIKISVVVIPQELADKKAELEQRIKELIDQGVENIEEFILQWIKEWLETNVIEDFLEGLFSQCCPVNTAGLPAAAILVVFMRRRRKK